MLARRHVLQLGGLVVAGWAVGRALNRAAPIGRDLGDSDAAAAILADDHPGSGPADASLRLAVFSDYRCPACRRAFPALGAAVRADGDVRLLYKDWPIFGPPSDRAARVALATVAQGIYPAVHRRLMTDPRTLDDRVVRDVVISAGGDWARVEADLAAQQSAITARLTRHAQQALAIGLPGTPGYLAGRVLVVGALDRADFARLFARARDMA